MNRNPIVRNTLRLLYTQRSSCKMVKRIRDDRVSLSVGSASLTSRAKSDVKKDQKWLYPNGVVKRAKSTLLGSKHYYDNKDPGQPRRKHESNFFITINTNRDVSKHLEGAGTAAAAAKGALEQLGKDGEICGYLKFGPKSVEYQDDVYADVVESIEWNGAVETGENLDRLHCHVWLTVHHYSQVQINVPVFQERFKKLYNDRVEQSFGLDMAAIKAYRCNGTPYCNVKLLPQSDWSTVIKQYIHKAMRIS